MPGCAVFGCTTGYSKNKEKVQTFPFPMKNPITLKKWNEAVNRAKYKITVTSRVCEKHFKPSDFVPREQNVGYRNKPKKHATLKPTAVPSLFMKGGAPKKSVQPTPSMKPIQNDHDYNQPPSAEKLVKQDNQIPVSDEVEIEAGKNFPIVLI